MWGLGRSWLMGVQHWAAATKCQGPYAPGGVKPGALSSSEAPEVLTGV